MTGIRIDKATYTYPNGTNALNTISLTINQAESIGILGRNGAGKSTFVKLLNGLLHPSSGTIFVNEKPTTEYKSAELTKLVGLMFQNPDHQLFCNSVEDEINFSLKSLKLSPEDFQLYKKEIIDQLGLQDFLSLSPYNLSGGQKKKVSIATVLCRKPEFLVFDEPTIGQDKKQQQILEEIIQKAKSIGKTIIIVSHDTEFIYNNTERVIIFEKGQIIADGPTYDVVTNTKVLEESSVLEPQILQLVKLIRNQNKSTVNQPWLPELDGIRSYSDLFNFMKKRIKESG